MKTIIFLLASITVFSAHSYESQYSSIDAKDCVTIDASDLHVDAEIDFYEAECASFGGYRVIVEGGDIRYDPTLVVNGKKLAKFVKTGAFHDLGSKKIEWRYERTATAPFQNKIEYKAMIFRISASTVNSAGKAVNTSSLYVVKLDAAASCLVSIVSQSTDMNDKARKISDNVDNMTCMP